jgi:RNA polymerase sigma factor (sigma-70 family)
VPAYKTALAIIEEHGPRPRPGDSLRAFQVLNYGRGGQHRINGGIRGTITGYFQQDPNNDGLLQFWSELQLLGDEEPESTAMTVIRGQIDGESRVLIWWDLAPTLIRRVSGRRIAKIVERQLPAACGARRRWRGLTSQMDSEEIKSLLWEARHGDPDSAAFRILELAEGSVRAGMPSRRSGLAMEPLPEEPDAIPDAVHPLHEMPYDTEGRLDLDRALAGLDQRSQAILRMHGTGMTDREIGDQVGLTQQAVNNIRRAAQRKLRAQLSD